MEKLEAHQKFYDEHASQARLHEEQRERATSIILSIAGLLVGLVTFTKLSYWALPASLSIIVLGVYGFLFVGKHYERNRLHTTVMRVVRGDMERVIGDVNATPRSLSALRMEAEEEHYGGFRWPTFHGSDNTRQAKASSWIARQRLHVFWEYFHILIALLGLLLCAAIVLKGKFGDAEKPARIDIVDISGKISRVLERLPTSAAEPASR